MKKYRNWPNFIDEIALKIIVCNFAAILSTHLFYQRHCHPWRQYWVRVPHQTPAFRQQELWVMTVTSESRHLSVYSRQVGVWRCPPVAGRGPGLGTGPVGNLRNGHHRRAMVGFRPPLRQTSSYGHSLNSSNDSRAAENKSSLNNERQINLFVVVLHPFNIVSQYNSTRRNRGNKDQSLIPLGKYHIESSSLSSIPG